MAMNLNSKTRAARLHIISNRIKIAF